MSVSIDDLVSSFSASHVSQEAIDLATLQSQLANVIYYPSQNQSGVQCVTRRNSLAQPCNTPTPTSATTTTTFHWGEWEDPAARHRGQNPASYVAPAPLRGFDIDDDEMEDEQAVEDLLLNAHTPNQAQSATPPHRHQHTPKFRPPTAGHQHQHQYQYQQHHQPFAPAVSPPPPQPTQTFPLGSPNSNMYDATPVPSASSHFVNTDPFYLAAVQASASSPSSLTSAPPSFFAQAARPAPNSPFNLTLSAQQGHHALELESRTVLVGAGQSR